MCRLLVFLLDHPEGVQRVDYRNALKLSPRPAMRDHDLLFKHGLIENKSHPTKLLFGLTEKGKKLARLLKLILFYLEDADLSKHEQLIADINTDIKVQLEDEKKLPEK